MWSKWQWVTRTASTSAPIPSTSARIRSGSSPGSTTRAFSAPSRRRTKQFSAIGPTVSWRTSRLIAAPGASRAFRGPHPGPLPPPPHHHVEVVADGDVEGEHEGPEAERGADRATEDQHQEGGEDQGRDGAAGDRPAPGRRAVAARALLRVDA